MYFINQAKKSFILTVYLLAQIIVNIFAATRNTTSSEIAISEFCHSCHREVPGLFVAK